MSRRSAIAHAIGEQIRKIDGTGDWTSNIFTNVIFKQPFLANINDFPTVVVVPGEEVRQIEAAGFKWGILNIIIRVFITDEDDTIANLEPILYDIERVIDSVGVIEYSPGLITQDMRVLSIITDEGILSPLGIGEISVQVRYDIPNTLCIKGDNTCQ